ncbi:hypothetical protein GCM10010446_28770 [Streptomyces enissocaesilis]|uniref:Transposase n=1 Tax=Streptomyces enissocaesilis TaxID=332589 RepID=A0ABP6JQ20_9ACTN
MAWRAVPERYDSGGHPCTRFRRWAEEGTFTHVLRAEQGRHRIKRGSRGGRPRLPAFGQQVHTRHHVVERCFDRLGQWRGSATRYGRTAESCQAAAPPVAAAKAAQLGGHGSGRRRGLRRDVVSGRR